MDTSEKSYEEKFVERLLVNGFVKRSPEDYDKSVCLDKQTLLNFVKSTQPREWEKLIGQYGSDTENRFFRRVFDEIEKRTVIDVLRNGIKDRGTNFELVYFKPASGLNLEHADVYKQNKFSVIRQLVYNDKYGNSLDMVLFINGIPISTLELKNAFTGQYYTNAINQYRKDRDPKEKIFQHCFAHFAVDNDTVFFSSKLAGVRTEFLPFNKDVRNPEDPRGFKTAYLYEDILGPDSLLDIIENFVQKIEIKDRKTSKILETKLLFPRFHQLTAVRELIVRANEVGPGKNYLIEHSAGSGKTFTISWLAHQLTKIYDSKQERVFDSIVVVSDRRVIDKQLKEAVTQFEKTPGVVKTAEKSEDLRVGLEKGKNIIVTTAQKFSYVVDLIGEIPGKNFALIIDEAHSSQGGETTHAIHKTFSYSSLEDAEKAEEGEEEKTIYDDLAEKEMKTRGPLKNVSFFGFTATPKPQTLELFGEKQPDGSYKAFSIYSMRQAIEEGFILDVLENYTTYKTYFNLLKKIEDDPEYEKDKVIYLLMKHVDLHGDSIKEKVGIILDHFDKSVKNKINGQAKAMVVTKSRLHAVRYKNEIDRQLRGKNAGYKALAAFTGEVKDGTYRFTETSINNGVPESRTKEEFNSDQYRIMVVANKYQTGFDQPLLHTMYVDKKLKGVNAVQTLSRLNRKCPFKDETMILDFVNETEDIQSAFQEYYQTVILSQGTDPNVLYDFQRAIEEKNIIDNADVNKFNEVLNTGDEQSDLHRFLEPAVNRFIKLEKNEKIEFKDLLRKYLKTFSFVTQLITFTDPTLEKLYQYSRFLIKKIPLDPDGLPREVIEAVDIENFVIEKKFDGKLVLRDEDSEFGYVVAKVAKVKESEIEPLSEILNYINEISGIELSEHDKSKIQEISKEIQEDETFDLSRKAEGNSRDGIKILFDKLFDKNFVGMYNKDTDFFLKIQNNKEARKALEEKLFDLVMANKV